MIPPRRSCLLLLLALCCGTARAEMVTRRWGSPPKSPPGKAEQAPPRPPTAFVTETRTPPVVDGKLTDEAWAKAPVLNIARSLDGLSRAAQPTEVRLLRDATTLYIAFQCVEPAADKIRATARDHDAAIWEDDSVEFFLGGRDVYYHFGVNAVGSTYDARGKDNSWNSGMRAAVLRGASEWSAEVAIPLQKLTGTAKAPDRLAANFNRNRYVTGGLEESAWSPTYSGDSHVPGWFGELFLKEPPPEAQPPPKAPTARQLGAVEIIPCEGGEGIVRFDLSDIPRQTRVYRADLLIFRDAVITGQDEEALVNIEIYAGARATGKPLALRAPWFDRFDATDAVQAWVSGMANDGFLVKACPRWNAKATCLDVAYEGRPQNVPPQAGGLKVLHRAGQTFITWIETEKRIADERATWGTLQKALAELDAQRVVRYRIFRHTEPIHAKNLVSAELLAEVKPLSGYNVEGRSLEALIYQHRRRSADDIPFARQLAANWYFGRYSIDMPEMAEVEVKRFVIDEGGKPLPLGSGLYVHQPSSAGKAYYAVASCVDGVTNTVDFSPTNATTQPVEETTGVGEPVFQEAGTLKVFWDYPGERRYYVQWCAPPLANLPNQYFNWSVYLPAQRPRPAPVRVFLERDRHMRPSTTHRKDTILVSGRDGPVWSFWYGYHEAVGTLKSFRQGIVQPYTTRRLLAFIDWVTRTFDGDTNRLSAVGGTEALYYGVRHADRFAYVLAERPDPNPKLTPAFVQIQTYKYNPPRPQREAVWGRVEWKIPCDKGTPVWDEFDLISYINEDPKREMAFLSMGPASLSPAWPRQVEFMKALWQARQPFCARFYWGGGEYLPLPETDTEHQRTGDVFDISLDKPTLALRNNSNDMGLDEEPFAQGVARYWGGGRIADSRRWLPDIIDQDDRFEVTIHGQGRVAYAGGGTSDVTPRRCRNFKPKPGEALRWENVDLNTGKAIQSGQAQADEHGLVTVPQVQFGSSHSRLRILRAK